MKFNSKYSWCKYNELLTGQLILYISFEDFSVIEALLKKLEGNMEAGRPKGTISINLEEGHRISVTFLKDNIGDIPISKICEDESMFINYIIFYDEKLNIFKIYQINHHETMLYFTLFSPYFSYKTFSSPSDKAKLQIFLEEFVRNMEFVPRTSVTLLNNQTTEYMKIYFLAEHFNR